MNILFVSIGRLPHIEGHSISVDLIHELMARGHNVYAVCAADLDAKERVTLTDECGCKVLRVKIGANKKANIIVKGITTLREPGRYISAIKKYFSDIINMPALTYYVSSRRIIFCDKRIDKLFFPVLYSYHKTHKA